MTRFAGIIALCLALPAAALAQTIDRLDQRYKLLGFESVGRLDSGGGHCTAAMVARDVVLTAAHCVHGKGDRFTFRAGYSDGAAIATRSTRDVVIAPAYLQAKARGDRAGEIANDVALVRLTSPIYEVGTNPYDLAQRPRQGAALTLASYGRGRLEALTLERGCALQALYRGGILEMSCEATFGSSGAPVFVQENGRVRILSIVSSGNDDVTLGMQLSQLVPPLMTQLRKRQSAVPVSNGARRLSVGDSMTGGARFVRPPGGS